MRIDLPANPAGDIRKQSCQISQSDLAHNHEIYVTMRFFFLACERSEYKSYFYAFPVAQRIFYHIHQAARLQDKGPDVRVKRMGGIGPIINSIAVPYSGDDIETLELLQFRLYGADGETGLALDLAHVERRIGDDSKKDAKDFRPDF